MITCKFCEKTFPPKHGGQMYCTPKCSQAYYEVRAGATTKEKVLATWEARKNGYVECLECGKRVTMTPRGRYARFCSQEHTSKYHYRKNKERYRATWLKNQYDITLEDYARMHAAQDGACAMCGAVQDALDVDHNHTTNAVRGLLCNHCNQALGLIEKHMESALSYLKRTDKDMYQKILSHTQSQTHTQSQERSL